MTSYQGWKVTPLGKAADIVMGQSPDSRLYSEQEIGVPFLQGCAEFGDILPQHRFFCSQHKKMAYAGSILFSVRAPVGKLNVADQDYVIGRGLASISGVTVATQYLEHFLRFEEERFRTASQGSTFDAINSTELAQWPVLHPTCRQEQMKVAEFLSTIDRAIERTKSLITKQQRIRAGLIHDLLTCGIDEHDNLRSERTHKFKDSPLGRIPVEWKLCTIDDIAIHVGSGITPRGGESVYETSGVLFIRSQNVHFGGLRLDDVAYIPERIHLSMQRSEIWEHDVLLNITGASIGRCCRMPKVCGHANVNQHVCAIRLYDVTEAKAGVLAAILESNIGQRQITILNAGGNREGLNYQQIRNLFVPWPKHPDEFNRLYRVMNMATRQIHAWQASVEKLCVLKTGLMQDLLTARRRLTEFDHNRTHRRQRSQLS